MHLIDLRGLQMSLNTELAGLVKQNKSEQCCVAIAFKCGVEWCRLFELYSILVLYFYVAVNLLLNYGSLVVQINRNAPDLIYRLIDISNSCIYFALQ